MKEDKILVKIFITKYALTSGIIETEGELKNEYAYAKPEGWLMPTLFTKNDFYFTIEEALADCEVKRLKKINSLMKQIDKLKLKTFK